MSTDDTRDCRSGSIVQWNVVQERRTSAPQTVDKFTRRTSAIAPAESHEIEELHKNSMTFVHASTQAWLHGRSVSSPVITVASTSTLRSSDWQSQPRSTLPPSAVCEPVASIQIGSQYCSTGYSWKNSSGAINYRILDNWPECLHCPEKDRRRTLSQVLIEKPAGKFVGLGYNAHIRYLNNTPRRRKKLLHFTDLTDLFGKELLTKTVTDGLSSLDIDYFSLCKTVIVQLRKYVLMGMEKNGLPISNAGWEKGVLWCVTVNSERLKSNMEDILSNLQIQKYKVLLSRDAILSHLALFNSTTSEENSLESSITTPRTTSFISVHIGASTTEVTFTEHTGNVCFPAKTMKGAPGGQEVTNELYTLLIGMFGEKMMQTYKNENHEGYIDLLSTLEKAKRSARPDQDLVVHLPFSFGLHFKKKSKARLSDYARRMGCSFSCTNNSVTFRYNIVLEIFAEVTNKIVIFVRQVLQDKPPSLTATAIPIYLSGGFCQNALFQFLLRQVFSRFEIVLVPEPVLVPLLGSLKLLMEPEKVPRTLRSRYTIGVTAAAHCDREALYQSLIDNPGDEGFVCNAFVPFLSKDEYLTSANHVSVHNFFAATPTQDSILVRIFLMEDQPSGSVFEDSMECVSQLQMHVPREKRGISTGRLFVFQVILKCEAEPEGILVTVQDSDQVVYGTSRIIRKISC